MTTIMMLISILLMLVYFPCHWLYRRGSCNNKMKDFFDKFGGACAFVGLGLGIFMRVVTHVPDGWMIAVLIIDVLVVVYYYWPYPED